jgi:hypothetical protein
MESKYVQNIIDPFNCPAVQIPDEHKQLSLVKTVVSTDSFNVTSVNDTIMLVNYFNSRRRQIRVYKYNTSSLLWDYYGNIPQEEDLGLYFDYIRPISGGMIVKSSTISGTKFTLNGLANSAILSAATNINSLTYKNILSYAHNNTDKLAGVSISDGIVSIAYPGDFQYASPIVVNETNTLFNQTARVPSDFGYSQNWGVANFSTAGCAPGTRTQLWSLAAMPDALRWINQFGSFQLDYKTAGNCQATGQVIFSMTVYLANGDYKTWSQTVTPTTAFSLFSSTSGATPFCLDDSMSFSTDQCIKDIVLAYESSSTAGFTLGVGGVQGGSYVRLTGRDMYSFQDKSTAAVTIITSVDPANSVVVDGINHYEVIPNADLGRNLPLSSPSPHREVEMSTAMTISEHAPEIGFPMVCTRETYERTRSRTKQVLTPEGSLEASSKFGNELSSLWKTVKPFVRMGLPLLSRGLDVALPGSGTILNSLGSSLLSSSVTEHRSLFNQSGGRGQGLSSSSLGAGFSDAFNILSKGGVTAKRSLFKAPVAPPEPESEEDEEDEPVIVPDQALYAGKFFLNDSGLNGLNVTTTEGSGNDKVVKTVKSTDDIEIKSFDPVKTLRPQVVLGAYDMEKFYDTLSKSVVLGQDVKYLGHADFPLVFRASDNAEPEITLNRIVLSTKPACAKYELENSTVHLFNFRYTMVADGVYMDERIPGDHATIVNHLKEFKSKLVYGHALGDSENIYLSLVKNGFLVADVEEFAKPISGLSWYLAAYVIVNRLSSEPVYTGTLNQEVLADVPEKLGWALENGHVIVLNRDAGIDIAEAEAFCEGHNAKFFDLAQMASATQPNLPFMIGVFHPEFVGQPMERLQALAFTSGFFRKLLYNEQQVISEVVLRVKKQRADEYVKTDYSKHKAYLEKLADELEGDPIMLKTLRAKLESAIPKRFGNQYDVVGFLRKALAGQEFNKYKSEGDNWVVERVATKGGLFKPTMITLDPTGLHNLYKQYEPIRTSYETPKTTKKTPNKYQTEVKEEITRRKKVFGKQTK